VLRGIDGGKSQKNGANGRAVRVEILAGPDCPNVDMTVALVERVAWEERVPIRVERVTVTSEANARRRRVLGSPTVRVNGRDVEPGAERRTDFAVACRVYRTERGLIGWPDERWLRAALLEAVAADARA
jgi:hypothetical protein